MQALKILLYPVKFSLNCCGKCETRYATTVSTGKHRAGRHGYCLVFLSSFFHLFESHRRDSATRTFDDSCCQLVVVSSNIQQNPNEYFKPYLRLSCVNKCITPLVIKWHICVYACLTLPVPNARPDDKVD